MKTSVAVAAIASAMLAIPGYAQDADRRVLVAQADSERASGEPQSFSYKPPLRGAPVTRVGGGTRSVGSTSLTVSVLAPNETGFTSRDQPTIYWYVSEPLTRPVELTLSTTEPLKDAASPSLEIMLQPPIAEGVHAVRLADHGIALKPGVEYQWFVAVVANPAQRSNDVIAGGAIKRVAAEDSDSVRIRLKDAPSSRWPAVYAESGLWYDAIDQLSRDISANPADARLRQQRAALLEQVGLREAAAFDRATIR
jgi:Domain of Unknown Function (DUF928)